MGCVSRNCHGLGNQSRFKCWRSVWRFMEPDKKRLCGGATGSAPPVILLDLVSGVLPSEVARQTSSLFPVTGKIGMTSSEVVDQTSSPLLVVGKIMRLDSICSFHFNNSSFISIYFSSKYSDVVRLVYHDAGLAILTGPQGRVSSKFHPRVALSYCFALSLVTFIIINK
ncbi:unnamed protein product [Cuscuta europaea]|uniref:Uncharacterized protein n=1 Tax=Cuscuta europaea TaxID=41803 RepID=A0A9P0Z300_CUSEU|nr:unnamed protein product [Cuscuta europaea]